MSVYVGPSSYPFGRMIMCHMVADTVSELHRMANLIEIDHRHFQSKLTRPHYDICKSKRRLAVKLGALEVTEQKIVEVLGERLTD